jgi:hypothetical protein
LYAATACCDENGKKLNAFTGVIVGVLVLLSVVLTASVLFPPVCRELIEDRENLDRIMGQRAESAFLVIGRTK